MTKPDLTGGLMALNGSNVGLAGAMLATAGGAEVRVWNVLGGGRLVARLTNFQKTVTCVSLSPMAGPDSAASARLLAGSLDGHVRVRAFAKIPTRTYEF